MDNNTDQPKGKGKIEIDITQKKRYAQEAGISFGLFTALQSSTGKRQTRSKKESYKTIEHTNPIEKPNPSLTNYDTNSNSTSNKMIKTSKPNMIAKSQKVSEKLKKISHTLPKSVDQFFQSFTNFFSSIFPPNQENSKFIQLRKSELFQLFNVVISHGGIVSIISNGQKNHVLEPFTELFGFSTAQKQFYHIIVFRVFEIYKKFLFHFQYYLVESITFKQYNDATELFGQATFVSQNELSDFLIKTPLDPKYFQYDILVFRNGEKVIKIDSEQISLDKVGDYYKDYNIDIRIQKALDYGFKPKTMRNQPYQMKIGQYTTYQKLSQQYATNELKIDSNFIDRLGKIKQIDVNGTTFKQRVKNQQIFFGVNFDPQDGLLFNYIGEKTDGTFLGFKQEFDFLSYLDHQVPGCSFPQFYFKVKGVWTGGHQENINMCAVNINHGPDASQWYTMQFKYVEELRAQLKKEFKMDLYAGEGLWYEKINWFVEQGKYPIKKIIQKKGDIVISGPGTLHWVRSHGVALQSAWNQFPITYNALRYAFHRQQENEKIHFIRSNVIPLKRLTLKLLNHPRPELTQQIKSLCIEKIRLWLDNQQKLYDSLISEEDSDFGEEKRFEKLDDLQGFCMKCKQQIFIYFVNGKSASDVVCLGCYKKEFKGKKKSKRVFIRHEIAQILELVRLTQLGEPFKQIESFCSNYIGNVPFKCVKNEQKVDKEEIFLQKVNNMNKDLNKYDSERLKVMTEKMKNKKKTSLKQDDQEIQIKEEQKKPQEMELQVNEKLSGKPSQSVECRIKNNVKYIGKHSHSSGWWDFIIPQQLMVCTEQNHAQLLKLIEEQQYLMKKCAKIQHRKPPFFNYHINYSQQPHYKNRNQVEEMIEAEFSSQSEDQKNCGRKKIHKNQDCGSIKSEFKDSKYFGKDGLNKENNSSHRQRQKIKIKLTQSEKQQKQSEISLQKRKRRSRSNSSESSEKNSSNSKDAKRHRQGNFLRNYRDFHSHNYFKNDESSRQKFRQSQSRNQRSSNYNQSNSQRSQSRHREKTEYRNNQRYENRQNYQRGDRDANRQFTPRKGDRRDFRDGMNQQHSTEKRDHYHQNRDYRERRDYRDRRDSQNDRYSNNFRNQRYERDNNNNYRSQCESRSQRSNSHRFDDRRQSNFNQNREKTNYDEPNQVKQVNNDTQSKKIEIEY